MWNTNKIDAKEKLTVCGTIWGKGRQRNHGYLDNKLLYKPKK